MPEQEKERQSDTTVVRKRDKNMATQSQGIKQLMAAEKEAAQVVNNARKSECFAWREAGVIYCYGCKVLEVWMTLQTC